MGSIIIYLFIPHIAPKRSLAANIFIIFIKSQDKDPLLDIIIYTEI
jgi:hypothetical protein